MSEKKVFTVFMEKMAADEDFAAKVKALQTPPELVALAKTVGVALSEAQAQKGLACIQKLAEEGGTLTDDALDGIAGGVGYIFINEEIIEQSANSSGC